MRIIRGVFAIIVAVAIFMGSTLFFRYYMDYFTGRSSYEGGNFTEAVKIFNGEDKMLKFDDWKNYFNIASSYYMADLQGDAIDNYKTARDLAAKQDNDEAICQIDNNTSFSYERSFSTGIEKIHNTKYTNDTDGKKDKANDIREQLNILVQAILTRQQKVNANCLFMGVDFYKINQDNLAKDKDKYDDYNKAAFELDGVKSDNEISSDKKVDTSRMVNSLDEATSNKKIDELQKQEVQSQIEYNNNQELKQGGEKEADGDSDDTKTPW
jgi:hypothetical protein